MEHNPIESAPDQFADGVGQAQDEKDLEPTPGGDEPPVEDPDSPREGGGGGNTGGGTPGA